MKLGQTPAASATNSQPAAISELGPHSQFSVQAIRGEHLAQGCSAVSARSGRELGLIYFDRLRVRASTDCATASRSPTAAAQRIANYPQAANWAESARSTQLV